MSLKSTPSVSFLDLIHRARQGDAVAQDRLFQRYRPYLRMLCAAQMPPLCQQREDASDIVQQTLIDATRGLPGFEGATEAEFDAWMSRLLERNILQSVRRHTADMRDVRREVIERRSGVATFSAIVGRQVDEQHSSCGRKLVKVEMALQLAQALEKLPTEQRLAVEMRYLSQLPLRVIAEQMGKTTGAVAGLIRRGVEFLREIAPEELGEA